MDNLFEFVQQQLLCEKDIIQRVYDLLSLLNSEFARELLEKQQGDFIITYYFSRQSRIKKFNKVSDELINFIFKYRNYNYMMQNQFDKIMQAITMCKTLQANEEYNYQITDILDIGTMFRLLELDWIKRHNMTKQLSQPQIIKKSTQTNMNQINESSSFLLSEKDTSMQLNQNLSNLISSSNKNQIFSNSVQDQAKQQKDENTLAIQTQKYVIQELEKYKNQQNQEISKEEVDSMIKKNQLKSLEFFQSFKSTWNFKDLKQPYFDEISEKSIFHSTLSDEQVNILNKYEQSLSKCRSNVKNKSRRSPSPSNLFQEENILGVLNQENKIKSFQETKDENSQNLTAKNQSDQKIKQSRGGFRRRKKEISPNLNQQEELQQSISKDKIQQKSKAKKQKQNSRELQDQNEQLNQAMCYEQAEIINSNKGGQNIQSRSQNIQIQKSVTLIPNLNLQHLEKELKERSNENYNKIKQEFNQNDELNSPNQNRENLKFQQMKFEENHFSLQSPPESEFNQDKIMNFLANSFLNSPFPSQFNSKIEQFELEQLKNDEQNSQPEQQQTQNQNQKQNELSQNGNINNMEEEKNRQQIEPTFFEDFSLNNQNFHFDNMEKTLAELLNYDFSNNKFQSLNNLDQIFNDNQACNHLSAQEMLEQNNVNDLKSKQKDQNQNQNQIQSKDQVKQEDYEMENNQNKQTKYQELAIEEEESQLLEQLIQTDKFNKILSQVNIGKITYQKMTFPKEISGISNQAENASSLKESPTKFRIADFFELKPQCNKINNSNQDNTPEKSTEPQLDKNSSPKSLNKTQKIIKEKKKKKIGKTFKDLTVEELEIIKKSELKDASNLAKQLGMSYQTMRKIIAKVQNI